MSMFAALCLAAGCADLTQPAAGPDEGTVAPGEPAASDVAAEDVAEASTALETCATGPIQCCNSLMETNPTTLAQLGGLLGIALPDLGGYIGLSCSPMSILGPGGNSCSAQPVCCANNSFGGLISLGCVPVNPNL